jgi:anti-sigma-K factor RskA
MTVHEQFAEDLALYSLGALEGEEKLLLEKHLATCPSCRREVEQLRGDAALLALSTAGPRPPVPSRARLLQAIAKEPRAHRERSRAPWWAAAGWIAAAAVMVVLAVVWRQNVRMSSMVSRLSAMLERERTEDAQNRRAAEILQDPDATSYEVLPISMRAVPAGKAIYSRHRGLVFMASNMRPLPPQKAYELWLIPVQGAPIPAGVFKPDARGGAVVMNPPLPAGVEAKAFAITVEPEQGSTTPTLPIVMMSTGS